MITIISIIITADIRTIFNYFICYIILIAEVIFDINPKADVIHAANCTHRIINTVIKGIWNTIFSYKAVSFINFKSHVDLAALALIGKIDTKLIKHIVIDVIIFFNITIFIFLLILHIL